MASTLDRLAPFVNEPIRTFADPNDVASLAGALARARTRLGVHYPVLIDGKPVDLETRQKKLYEKYMGRQ